MRDIISSPGFYKYFFASGIIFFTSVEIKNLFMEKMNDLNDLLKHEIMDLYSAEEQIISAMPAMIEKARNPELKKSLKEHLKITEQQRKRLDQVKKLMGQEESRQDDGLLNRLFKNRQTCRGMEGIIEEGNKILKEDMDPDVMDAAIVASSQKIEHYEICGYGTARSFAMQLGLDEVAELLNQTLDEEYEADRLLTEMAENRINKEAESGNSRGSNGPQSRTVGSRSASKSKVQESEMEMASNRSGSSSAGRSSSRSSSRTSSASSPAKKSASSGSAAKSTGSRSSSGGRNGSNGRGSSRSK
jgi:ferritin-like metal-binding protein YciE